MVFAMYSFRRSWPWHLSCGWRRIARNSFLHLLNVNSGFDPHNVLTVATYVYGERYQKPEQELGLYKTSLRAVAPPRLESRASA